MLVTSRMWGITHISRFLTCEEHHEAKSTTGRGRLFPAIFKSQGAYFSLPIVKNLGLTMLAHCVHTGVEPVVTGKPNRRKHSQRSCMMWRPGSRACLAGHAQGSRINGTTPGVPLVPQVSLPPQNAVSPFVTPTQLDELKGSDYHGV